MSFTEQQGNWEALAEKDPMWAVLSRPEKRGGKWDEEEFYATGEIEASEVLGTLRDLGLPVPSRGLDVGCGPGRLTYAFARNRGIFDEMTGYDISPTMLEQARFEGMEKGIGVRFVLNETDDLSPFDDDSFDFVYCSKVLQHVDPDRIGHYMAEMVRVLKPGGVLFCQMLSHPTGWEGTTESRPDPEWGESGGPPPHYTVSTVTIDAMIHGWLELGVIIHQARLVEKGEGQSLFSYDYILEKR